VPKVTDAVIEAFFILAGVVGGVLGVVLQYHASPHGHDPAHPSWAAQPDGCANGDDVSGGTAGAEGEAMSEVSGGQSGMNFIVKSG
jgi:hypothetical protein